MLNHKIDAVKHHFRITQLSDWQQIRPEWILQIDGCGPATLDHIRLYLSARGVTLCDDSTPEFWAKHFADARIGAEMTERDCFVTCPFTILIDTREQQPFVFEGLTTNSDRGNLPLIVPHKFESLGNHAGDYGILGYKGLASVERKSMYDAHGTFLGWGDRRENFETELANLSTLEASAVVIECSRAELIKRAPSRGKKTAAENAKILFRQVLAWEQDYRVPFVFCESRDMAMAATFRILERFWRKDQEKRKTKSKTIVEKGKSCQDQK